MQWLSKILAYTWERIMIVSIVILLLVFVALVLIAADEFWTTIVALFH